MAGSEITPKHDSTLGLIFRLNALWAEVDTPAKTGDYDGWNNTLDRIYCNLLYRNKLEVVKDKNDVIISMKLSDDDEKEYSFLSKKIVKYKNLSKRITGKTKKGVPKRKIAKSLWYKSVMLKDIWLRKYMNGLKLYIKETKSTPGTAMWGGSK